MGSALVQGALQGFNMMERHQSRINGERRLSDMDKRNEQRYQDGQGRLADMDKRNDDRYQDTLEYRNQTTANTAAYRKQTADNTEKYRDWQIAKSESDTQWTKDQKMLGTGWDYFRVNGQVALEHEEMFKRNAGYDPRTFQKPEMRAAVKGLGEKMQQAVSSGKVSEVNNPETIKLFDTVFKDKFSSSIGKFDHVVGAEINDVSFAGFVPTDSKDGSVSFALKVTYDNGKSEIKPMTQGRSTDQDDPVLQMKPEELVNTIRSKMMMADMIERPEYWDKMGHGIGKSLSKRKTDGQNQKDKSQAAYRK